MCLLAYYENDRPGTGVLVATGLVGHVGMSVRRTFTIAHGFTGTVSDAGTGATVTFPAATASRALYAAWGETDGGPLTNGWPQANFAKVADVPANATSAAVTLPAAATDAPALRFFLEHPATYRAYVTDGLRAQFDGVYNAGTLETPAHDASSTNWLDLSGSGNTIWLPTNYVSVLDNALFSNVRKNADGTWLSKSGTYPLYTSLNGLDQYPYELTVEVATRRETPWTFTDNHANLQVVATTPLGYVGYRTANDKGFGLCYYGWNAGTKKYVSCYNSWFHATASASAVHTLGGRLAQDLPNCSFLMDGVADPNAATKEFYQEGEIRPQNYGFFSNPRAAVTVHAIRLYARRLSDAEMKRNMLVDAARFRGGDGTILAASALVRSGRLASHPSGSGLSLRVAAAPCARAVYAAWDTADRGSASNAWANVAYVATLPAGATRLDAVTLPSAARHAHYGRIFLVDVYDSASYVTNGLAGHWDGLDNTLVGGERSHSAATRTWSDLTGRGADLALPAYASVEANAIYTTNHVGVSAAEVAVTGVSSNSAALTLEVVAKHCGFQLLDDFYNLQSVCTTPLGALGYRKNLDNGLFCYTPGSSNKLDLRNWLPAGANVRTVNTIAITLSYLCPELWFNAARGDNQAYDYYQVGRTDTCLFFGAPRIGLRTYGVRIYTRLLSKEELAWNAGVDAVRYKGEAAPIRVSDLVDFCKAGSIVVIR